MRPGGWQNTAGRLIASQRRVLLHFLLYCWVMKSIHQHVFGQEASGRRTRAFIFSGDTLKWKRKQNKAFFFPGMKGLHDHVLIVSRDSGERAGSCQLSAAERRAWTLALALNHAGPIWWGDSSEDGGSVQTLLHTGRTFEVPPSPSTYGGGGSGGRCATLRRAVPARVSLCAQQGGGSSLSLFSTSKEAEAKERRRKGERGRRGNDSSRARKAAW